MKARHVAAVLLAAALCLGSTHAPSVSISDDAHVQKGEVHAGDVVVIMGDAVVEGEVTGSVVVILGSLRLSGIVDQDVVAVLTETTLEESAAIEGQMVNVGGTLDRAEGARIEGDFVNLDLSDFVPFSAPGWDGIWRFFLVLKLLTLAFLFVILVLITALVPRRLAVMAAAFPQRWGWAIVTGIGAYAAFAMAFVILFCTLIGIPLALALMFVMLATKWLGLAATLYLIGHTAGKNLFGREMAHLPAVLGGYVVYALLSLVPFLGFSLAPLAGIAFAMVSFAFALALNVMAVGLALVTRYGSEEPWRRSQTAAVPPPAPGGQDAGATYAAGAPIAPPPIIETPRS